MNGAKTMLLCTQTYFKPDKDLTVLVVTVFYIIHAVCAS